MKNKHYWILGIIIVVILITIFLINSIHKIPKNEPNWIKDLISKETNSPVANPPATISKCNYREEIVYELSGKCCDIPSLYYNLDGKTIMRGCGLYCSEEYLNFSNELKNCKVIWKDSRTYS
jgi:hypothetical protein